MEVVAAEYKKARQHLRFSFASLSQPSFPVVAQWLLFMWLLHTIGFPLRAADTCGICKFHGLDFQSKTPDCSSSVASNKQEPRHEGQSVFLTEVLSAHPKRRQSGGAAGRIRPICVHLCIFFERLNSEKRNVSQSLRADLGSNVATLAAPFCSGRVALNWTFM